MEALDLDVDVQHKVIFYRNETKVEIDLSSFRSTCDGFYEGCVGSIHFTVSGFSTGSTSGKLTAMASLSLRMRTHSSFSSAEALISWCYTTPLNQHSHLH